MSLKEYHRKRRFDRTHEPRGRVAASTRRLFVIQKHAARHLHYDFRLELDGVLKSWAVPKGPSLDPAVKRLAMQVEDHPVEYGSFEGIIPHGEYGGGTVLLWDRGQWEPIGDPHEAFQKGHIKFKLHGQKLHGGWVLVRTGKSEPARQQWLLFKERDADAQTADDGDVLDDLPLSVASGRNLDEIAADANAVWSSKSSGNTKESSAHHSQEGATAYDARKEQFAGVRFTHPDKVLYAEQGTTKLELAEYYLSIADRLLPHIADRPLVLVRCPDGRGKGCFFQKHPPAGTPEALRRISVMEAKKTEQYLVADNVAAIVSLAQIGALEIHAWGSRADMLERPDQLLFDLDPDPAVPWRDVVQAAHGIRQFLQDLGLESFVKTTGGKGLHLVVPIRRRHEWEEVKAFSKQVADALVRADPAHFTANMSKAARHGKIYIDYLRNARGATAIVPYSTRARDGAPVSVPLSWGELTGRLHSDQFNIRNLGRRLASMRSDPWESIRSIKQGLTAPLRKLKVLA